MKKRKIYSVGVFASIALFFSIIALILSFLPLRMFALIPAGIAIYFTIVAYVLTRVFKTNRKYVYIVFGIAILSIGIASLTETFTTNIVVEDKEFEDKLEEQAEDIDSVIMEAFEDEVVEGGIVNDSASKLKKEPVEFEEEFIEEDIGEIEF